MKSRNIVLEGLLKGYSLFCLTKTNELILSKGIFSKDNYAIKKESVINYEVITKDSFTNGASAVVKGGLASAFLGAPGLLAGLSAKTDNIYWVAIEWKTHAKSLIEMDDYYYHLLIRTLF